MPTTEALIKLSGNQLGTIQATYPADPIQPSQVTFIGSALAISASLAKSRWNGGFALIKYFSSDAILNAGGVPSEWVGYNAGTGEVANPNILAPGGVTPVPPPPNPQAEIPEPSLPTPFNTASYPNLLEDPEFTSQSSLGPIWGHFTDRKPDWKSPGIITLSRPSKTDVWQGAKYSQPLKVGDVILFRYLARGIAGSHAIRGGIDFKKDPNTNDYNQVSVYPGVWYGGTGWFWVDQTYTVTQTDIKNGAYRITCWIQSGLGQDLSSQAAEVSAARLYIKPIASGGGGSPPTNPPEANKKIIAIKVRELFPGGIYRMTKNMNQILTWATTYFQPLGWKVTKVEYASIGSDPPTLNIHIEETSTLPLIIGAIVVAVALIVIVWGVVTIGGYIKDVKLAEIQQQFQETDAKIIAQAQTFCLQFMEMLKNMQVGVPTLQPVACSDPTAEFQSITGVCYKTVLSAGLTPEQVQEMAAKVCSGDADFILGRQVTPPPPPPNGDDDGGLPDFGDLIKYAPIFIIGFAAIFLLKELRSGTK